MCSTEMLILKVPGTLNWSSIARAAGVNINFLFFILILIFFLTYNFKRSELHILQASREHRAYPVATL
jgi:hypothetical protein